MKISYAAKKKNGVIELTWERSDKNKTFPEKTEMKLPPLRRTFQ